MSLANITAQLEHLIQDLYFPSETDTIWQVVVWPVDGPELTEATLRQYLDQPAAAPVVPQALADLAAQVQRRCRGYGVEGQAITAQHQQLFQYLEAQLSALQGFRVGKVTVEILIMGRLETGAWLGVRTQSVET
jgi:hypothetical protein